MPFQKQKKELAKTFQMIQDIFAHENVIIKEYSLIKMYKGAVFFSDLCNNKDDE